MANQVNWKLLVTAIIDKSPRKGAGLKSLYRKVIFLRRRYGVQARILMGNHFIPDPESIYWIDPKRIVYYTNYCSGDRKEFKKKQMRELKTSRSEAKFLTDIETKEKYTVVIGTYRAISFQSFTYIRL